MRTLLKIIDAKATNDGDGVKIHRVAGSKLNAILDPFLMVDEMNSDNAADYIGGFPEHPHRGFETITYMINGRMRHKDHMGNEGVIEAGDVQWMTAGRGVLHSEMPEQDSGLLHGFQIWLNLPATEKMKPAAYHDIPSANITEHNLQAGGLVRVIAGELKVDDQNLIGPMPMLSTEPLFIDLHLAPNESVKLQFTAENSALVYIYQGCTNENTADELKQRQMGVYSQGEYLSLRAGAVGANILLFSGRPLKEPIVQYGPFVMNSAEQIEQALQDYREGALV